MFYAYVLKSKIRNWYYIGHTSNIDVRLKNHNLGNNKSTKPYKPFEIVYTEKFKTRSEAFGREMELKRYKHGEAFRKLLG